MNICTSKAIISEGDLIICEGGNFLVSFVGDAFDEHVVLYDIDAEQGEIYEKDDFQEEFPEDYTIKEVINFKQYIENKYSKSLK